MDDTLLLAWGKSLSVTNEWVKQMMTRKGGRLEWSHMHQCEFVLDKFGVMGLTRRRELYPLGRLGMRPVHRRPIYPQGVRVLAVTIHKFLGVMLDQELRWKEQCQYTIQKGVKWVTQYQRIAKTSKGVSAKFMRQFFISVTIPRMVHATDLFLMPGLRISKGTKGFISKLAKIQRQASLHITGALRSTPMDAINPCADLVPFHLLVERLMYRSATRMVTLPWSHPLAKHITCTVNRYVKSHREPLHKVMHGFKV